MQKNERIASIDGLRGVAILLVVIYHSYARWPEYIPWATQYKDFPLFEYGWMGVQLFFIISGFVIYMTLERCSSFLEFIYRRWLRLFPAMLVASLLVFITAGYFYERPAGIPSLIDIVPGLFFIESGILTKIFGVQFNSIEGAFWSLYIEVKFYLIFGAIYFLTKSKSIHFLIILFLIGFIARALIYFGGISPGGLPDKILFGLLSLNHFGWFCIGALLYLQNKNGGWHYITGALMLFPMVLFMTGGKNIGTPIFGSLIFLLFLSSIFLNLFKNILNNKFFAFLGFISYPLYLIHENAMISLTIKVHNLAGWLPGILSPIPGLVLIVFFSYLIAYYVEPVIKTFLTSTRLRQ